jgi:hypothetical protein
MPAKKSIGAKIAPIRSSRNLIQGRELGTLPGSAGDYSGMRPPRDT